MQVLIQDVESSESKHCARQVAPAHLATNAAIIHSAHQTMEHRIT